VETIEEILELARLSRVTITEACSYAGVSNNTVSRWRKGVQPRPVKFFAFRRAVVNLAFERGSLTSWHQQQGFTIRQLLEMMR
jgi:hypothetical protein